MSESSGKSYGAKLAVTQRLAVYIVENETLVALLEPFKQGNFLGHVAENLIMGLTIDLW